MSARGIIAAYLAFILVPIAMLVIGAFGSLWVATPLPEGLTLRWFTMLTSDVAVWRGLGASLMVATGALVFNLVIVPPLAAAVAAQPGRFSSAIEVIMRAMPVAVPTGVFGFALIGAVIGPLSPMQGSIAELALAHTILTLPYMLAPVLAELRHRDAPALLQMAASLGATRWHAFVTVLLPAARGSLVAGAAAVMAVSLGEFQLANLVAGFLDRTYPLVVADAFQRATGFACAAALPLVILAFANAVVGRAITHRMGRHA